MTLILLAIVGLALLNLPAATRARGRHLLPNTWAWLVTVCLVSGAALWLSALALMGLPALVAVTHASGLADTCVHALRPFQTPGSPVVGLVASAVAVWTVVRVSRAARRVHRAHEAARIESWLGTHTSGAGFDLVVLPCRDALAMSVPGLPNQVVVSEALVETLSPEHLDVVLRHEAAHLDHRHHRYLAVASIVSDGLAYLPVVRRSARVLATALERWADEDAGASAPGGRRAVRDALVAVTTTVVADGAAAFAAAGTIIERITALEVPPPARGITMTALLAAPAMTLLGIGGVALAAGQAEIRVIIAVIGLCFT